MTVQKISDYVVRVAAMIVVAYAIWFVGDRGKTIVLDTRAIKQYLIDDAPKAAAYRKLIDQINAERSASIASTEAAKAGKK